MNRLSKRLESLRRDNRKALSLFVTAGFPSADSTVPLVIQLADAGADLIELGIPFSDPIADGPTIQNSSEVALRNGMSLPKTLEIAREIRKQSDVPLVLMGYANPIYAYGLMKFLGSCKETGIDGTIIPDMPLEESEEYRTMAQQCDIATIFLAAPTTPPERLVQLDQASSGFLYCVSITGVTGERQALAAQAESFLRRARASVKKNPLLVGFGISTPEDARRVAALSDGIIVGSALVKILQNANAHHAIDHAVEYARSLREALDS
ncbi:MAG: tryptophan synthase subunit alpha [Ignavibacteria bacterium]|nr:tryptophan synthase subunit alpha [Ignavibacteria bacterium]